MNKNPKVSVVMSVYNGEKFLREAVDSIINQTFTDFEFIIINDGSIDSSVKIIESFHDLHIRLVHNEENIGLTKSLNKGIELSHGKYIARMDADDVSLPNRLEAQTKFLDKHPEVILVSSNIEFIDCEGRSMGQSQRDSDPTLVSWYMLFHNHLGGHSQVMFRRKPAIDLGGYSEACRYSQDHEFWLRLCKLGDIVILPDVLLKWRRHEENISVTASSEQEAYSLESTRHSIAQLISEEISIEQVADLRGFWSGYFPDSHRVGTLHYKLKRIYRAFLQERVQWDPSKPRFSRQLRILIGKQFVKWMQSQSKRHGLISKLKISLYAFAWYPLGILRAWLNELWDIQLHIFHISIRKASKRITNKTPASKI